MTQTNTDKTVSTERLREMLADAQGVMIAGYPVSEGLYQFTPKQLVLALTELLASRTQEPDEWQVEAVTEKLIDLLNQQGFIHPKREDHRKLAENMASELVRAASITPPAPERSKEEVERVARAIAQADEQNGGPPYEYRISLSKHAKEQLFDEARAAIKAVLEAMTAEDSARQNGKEPVVKRLEWIDMGEGPRCITVCGTYAIYPSTSRGKPTLILSGMPKGLFGKFASIEEAKAAAQADYEQRIKSALSKPGEQ